MYFREYIENVFTRCGIELSSRLICEEDRRIIDDRSYDSYSLRLTARELIRILVPKFFFNSDLIKKFFCLLY